MEVLPLHKHKYLTDACAEVLNNYWPRSEAARNHSLSKSCDHMPVCLAFVRQDGIKVEVIGFSKISAVQGIQDACLVESVIVREMDRGKGLGRVLMRLTEDYAQKLGLKTMYLNTLDKEGFYERIGYTKCSPVISLGDNAQRVPEDMLRKLLGTSVSTPVSRQLNPNGSVCHAAGDEFKPLGNTSDNTTVLLTNSNEQNSNHSLSTTLPPAPPPPPPPKENVLGLTGGSSSYNWTVTRMYPNCIIWMKKDL